MNNTINYISKCLDLKYCLDTFINSGANSGKKVYMLHLDSTTTDRELFINKIYKNFRDRVNINAKNKYSINEGVGGIEQDSNGYWHIHLLATFKDDYATSTIYNKNTELRKLWLRLHKKYTGKELNKQRYSCELVNLDKKDNLTKYISKAVKHHRRYQNKPDYLPKAFNDKSSFRCIIGKANRLWCKKDMPSERLTDNQIILSLKSTWNEYYKAENLQNLELGKNQKITKSTPETQTKENKIMKETKPVKQNEFVFTLGNIKQSKLIEIIQNVLNQYIKYRNPYFDIFIPEDRKLLFSYCKYCIQFEKDNENGVYHSLVETLLHTLLDYYINEDYEDINEYKIHLAKSCRRIFKETENIKREYLNEG